MKNSNNFRSKIMKIAHQLYATGLYSTFGAALSASWKRWKLTAALRSGIAYFSFIKADKSQRDAIGTLRNGNFNYQSKGSSTATNYNVVKYWDVEKSAFRAVRIDRLTAIRA